MPDQALGFVVALWRYPVKSMMGEELNASEVTNGGLLGDRAYAVVDAETGKVASAKNPKKWPKLFDFRANYVEPPEPGRPIPSARITLPGGTIVLTGDAAINDVLSRELGCNVRLARTTARPVLEEYWPDIEGLLHREKLTDEAMREGTFFDSAVVHVLTTNTLQALRAAYPQGRFEVRRFRPNMVVQLSHEGENFVESDWVGRGLALGREVRLNITGPCPRCVMTTLPQGDLPRDLGILKTAAKHNHANVGIYATVANAGRLRRGDVVTLEEAARAAS